MAVPTITLRGGRSAVLGTVSSAAARGKSPARLRIGIAEVRMERRVSRLARPA